MLLNSRAKLQQQMFYCIALMRDPKLRLSTDSGRQRDFARMIQKALIDENPAIAKLVREADQEKSDSDLALNKQVGSANVVGADEKEKGAE